MPPTSSRTSSLRERAASAISRGNQLLTGQDSADADEITQGAQRWLNALGQTQWELGGSQSESGTVGLPKVQAQIGFGTREMHFVHPEQEQVDITSAGIIASVGVGLLPITLSASTYDMFSMNLGRVFSRTGRGLRPRDFSGVLNIIDAGCGFAAGMSLTLYTFSAIPLFMPGGWFTARATFATLSESLVADATCSVAGKTYAVRRVRN